MENRYIERILKQRRRDFLKTSALVAAHGLAWGCGDDDEPASRGGGGGGGGTPSAGSAIVIGAGMSGLAAARELKSRGFDVKVLEGRDRIGGRIWTNRDLGFPVDLGASWIEGTRGNPLSELADDLDVETRETDFDDVAVWDHDGARLSEGDLREIASEYEGLLGEVESLAGRLDRDISFGAAIERVIAGETLSAEERRALDWVLASQAAQAGAEMEDLSLAAVDADSEFGGGSVLFPNGYDAMVRGVAEDLQVYLSHVVSRIEHGDAGVRVTTDRGTFEADRAVVTLPLGVLKAGSVSFAPALPRAKRNAIGRLEMGVLNKVVLKFERKFWPDEPQFFGYMSNRRGEYPVFLNWHYFAGQPGLMAFTGGRFARAIEAQDDATVRAAVMRVLRTMFGSTVPEPTAMIRARWGRDPFAGGSYSHVPAGASPDDYDALKQSFGDRLFFAGEATIREYPATVHGAFLSGVAAAEDVTSRS